MKTDTENTARIAIPDFKSRGLLMMWCVMSLILAAYSVFLHVVFRSTSLDLALHSQLLWNLARGRFMTTSFLTHSFCANHVWPGLYLLIPFHEFFGITGLLVIQACVVAAGIFPVYYLTLDVTQRRDWATVLGLCYLLHPTVSIGVLFDFHPELLTMPLMLASFYFGRRKQYLWTFLFCILAMSLYEITALVYCMLGALMCFKGRYRKLGFVVLVLSSVYISVVAFFVMPAFREGLSMPHMERWWPPDVTARDLRQIWYLLFAVGFTPLLGLRYMVPAIPLLVLLTWSNLNLQMDIRFGYVAPAIPFFFLAAAYGARRLVHFRARHVHYAVRHAPQVVLILAVSLTLYFHVRRPIRSNAFSVRPNLSSIREAVALVPVVASLSADNHLGAHFSQREVLLLTPQARFGSSMVDYILFDLRENNAKNSDWWKAMRSIVMSGDYAPIFFSDGIVLLKAGGNRSHLVEDVLGYMKEIETVATGVDD